MDFGEVSHFADIDYRYPKLKFTADVGQTSHKLNVFLGCPVWTNKQLIARIKNQNDAHLSDLSVYSKSFNSIELNSSYYSVPSQQQIAAWRSQVPDQFLFFPKAPKVLTFSAANSFTPTELDVYLRSLSDFGSQLGDSFLQFSPYISPDEKRYLFSLLEALPTEDFHFHIELRHPAWFKDETRLGRLCDYLSKREIGFVITDTPGRRDVLHMRATHSRLLIRFKGNNTHETDFKRLNDWTDLLTSTPGIEQVAFFHHHSDEQYCANTIEHMAKRIQPNAVNQLPEIQWKKNPQLGLNLS